MKEVIFVVVVVSAVTMVVWSLLSSIIVPLATAKFVFGG
jgi:hypothetical protein